MPEPVLRLRRFVVPSPSPQSKPRLSVLPFHRALMFSGCLCVLLSGVVILVFRVFRLLTFFRERAGLFYLDSPFFRAPDDFPFS